MEHFILYLAVDNHGLSWKISVIEVVSIYSEMISYHFTVN